MGDFGCERRGIWHEYDDERGPRAFGLMAYSDGLILQIGRHFVCARWSR